MLISKVTLKMNQTKSKSKWINKIPFRPIISMRNVRITRWWRFMLQSFVLWHRVVMW